MLLFQIYSQWLCKGWAVNLGCPGNNETHMTILASWVVDAMAPAGEGCNQPLSLRQPGDWVVTPHLRVMCVCGCRPVCVCVRWYVCIYTLHSWFAVIKCGVQVSGIIWVLAKQQIYGELLYQQQNLRNRQIFFRCEWISPVISRKILNLKYGFFVYSFDDCLMPINKHAALPN